MQSAGGLTLFSGYSAREVYHCNLDCNTSCLAASPANARMQRQSGQVQGRPRPCGLMYAFVWRGVQHQSCVSIVHGSIHIITAADKSYATVCGTSNIHIYDPMHKNHMYARR